MRSRTIVVGLLAFATGVITTFLWRDAWPGGPAQSAHAQGSGTKPATDVPTLRAEVESLKSVVPDQAHAMMDVGYHFSNLWFAGQQANWPLADFYWSETRSHLRWAVRIKPVRQDSQKRDIKLADILQALETTPLKQLKDAINAKDKDKFLAAYRFTVEGCYACHKASEKPYLHPHIPEHPETRMMNFDATAEWPK